MVSHVKKPGVGPSQDPKAPRKTSKPKPNAKPRTRIRSRTSKCMHCRQRRVMCNGFKQTCVRCAKDVVLELQPQCMDVDSGFGNAEGNLPAPVEIWTADPMQIDSGSGSNDVDPVPHSEPNAPSTLAVAPEMGGEQQNAGDATVPSREHTLPFSFQGQPWSGAPTPSFLSGITPWTPMDSSTFTSLQPFVLPPENTSYEASMASAVDTNPPATPNHATSMPSTANMDFPTVADSSRGRGTNDPADIDVASPSSISITPMVPLAPKERAFMTFSTETTGQAPMVSRALMATRASEASPESWPSLPFTESATMSYLSTREPSAIVNSSASMYFLPETIAPHELMILDEPKTFQATMGSQAVVNQQAVVHPQVMAMPPISSSFSAATLSPPVNIHPAARDPTSFTTSQAHESVEPILGAHSASPNNPAPMIPFTFQRPAATKPGKPRPKKGFSTSATSRPLGGPRTRSQASTSLPAQPGSNPPARLIKPSIYRPPPPSRGPAVVTILFADTGSPEGPQLPMIVVSSPPESLGAVSNWAVGVDSSTAGYDARYLHPPTIVTFPPNAALPKPMGSTAMGPFAAKISAILRLGAAAKQGKPRPANAADYLCIIQSDSFSDEKGPKGVPNKLNQKLKRALLRMEQLAANPPPYSSSSSASSSHSSSPFFLIPPRSLSLELLAIYRHEVYFMYPFFNMHLFEEALRRLFMVSPIPGVAPADLGLGCSKETDGTTPLFQCALFMMLCHAVYFLDLDQEDKAVVSRIFWKCAKRFMTPDLLKRSSLAAVQTFLTIAVAINSSLLPGVQSKIPAVLASRIARSLGIDSEHDQTPMTAAGPVHDINRQAWYGCVMMNLFSETIKSNVALNSSMFETPLATVRHGSSSGSVELSFFIECVLHTEQLEKVLADIRRAREPVLKKGPRDGYNSFNDIVPELRRDLGEFIATLPEEPQWGASGLPSDCVHLVGFESQKTFSNARFMHLRAMLFRPILMQISLNDRLPSDIAADNVDPRVKDKTLMCAINCVDTAVNLILHLYQNYLLDVKSNREWWWDPYHTSTAGLILVMSQTSELLWTSIQVGEVRRAWTACQDMLGYGATTNHFYRDALTYLWDLNSSVAGCSVLENNYDALPRIKGPEPVTWSFYRTPYNQFLNPCSPFTNSSMVQHQGKPQPPGKAFPVPSKPSPNTGGYAAPLGSGAAPPARPATDVYAEPLRPSVTSFTTSSDSATAVYPAFTNMKSSSTPSPRSCAVPYAAAAAAAAAGATTSSPSPSPGTTPLTASLGFPSHAVAPDPTGSFASTSPASGSSHMSSSPGVIPYTPSSTAMLPYVAASNLSTIPYPSSSKPDIISYDVASSPNMAPYSPVSGFPTIPFVDPFMASFDPDPSFYGPSLGPSAALGTDFPVASPAAFSMPSSSSGMMPNLPPWDPNLANPVSLGGLIDLDAMPMDTQTMYQHDASMRCFPGYSNPHDEQLGMGNWRG